MKTWILGGFFCLTQLIANSQYLQIGQDIDGLVFEESGYSTALSGDGNRVVVGAPFSSLNGQTSGTIRVYQYTGLAWSQIGSDLVGEKPQDVFGNAVAINETGSRIVAAAVGATNQTGIVKVYEFNGVNWQLLGLPINAIALNDAFGITVDMDSNGSRIVIGASSNGTYAKTYEFNGANWVQLGQTISGNGYVTSIDPGGNTPTSIYTTLDAVQIFSTNGGLLHEHNIENNELNLFLKPGIYYVKGVAQNTMTKTSKIIVL